MKDRKFKDKEGKARESPNRSRRFAVVGQIEQIALLAILGLNNQAYGSQISKELKKRADIEMSIGALYSTLNRMEVKGLIEPSQKDNRSNRQYFRVTGKGRKLLEDSLSMVDKMRDGVLPVAA